VPDPYRWLEDVDAPATRRWIAAENALTRAWIDAIPARGPIERRLRALWSYERFGLPERHGEHYYFSWNDGRRDQPQLVRSERSDGRFEVVLDGAELSADGTVALAGTSFSPGGRYLAWATSDGGSDWRTWRVRDLERGVDLPDVLEWTKFTSPAWLADETGFYYGRFDEPERHLTATTGRMTLWFHAVGAPQADDVLVLAEPEQEGRVYSPRVTEDGRFLVIVVSEGSQPVNRVWFQDLTDPSERILRALDRSDAEWIPVGSDGWTFWMWTNKDAPRGRVVRIDPRRPRELFEIVPENAQALERVSHIGGRLVAQYLEDARTVVRVHEMDGALVRQVDLPGAGTASGFGGKAARSETFFRYESFVTPPSIYGHDVTSGETWLVRRPDVPFASEDYETTQVFYPSADGTRIPMFVTAARSLPANGAQPTILYGYGGFDNSVTPRFSPAVAAWLELGGVYASANLRGGGEYGREWHLAGTREHKQNVFDDFIAAAEWLVEKRITCPERLAIQGASNGGLLVGACLNQRPELFGAALPAVGVMDMLRYHLFTIGWAWAGDYGTADDADMFPHIRAYSPYHNVRPGAVYPATLVTTADHDDRVVPGHSFKYAAALQAAQAGPAPVLIRVETRAGHGSGKSTSQAIEETADRWAFLVDALRMGGARKPAD
jgi:prolyl oligopeptidase